MAKKDSSLQYWTEVEKVHDPVKYLKEGFDNEKELNDFIDHFASLFARDILEIKYKSHKREYYLGDNMNVRFNKGNQPHVDFVFISSNDEVILVECKNPKNTYAELSNSIGQILTYSCIAKENGVKIARLCIISTKYDDRIRKVIKEFNLPIEVYLISRTNMLKVLN